MFLKIKNEGLALSMGVTKNRAEETPFLMGTQFLTYPPLFTIILLMYCYIIAMVLLHAGVIICVYLLTTLRLRTLSIKRST